MKDKIIDCITNTAFLTIFAGIWFIDMSLGGKIIWTSIYTIFLCGLTMCGSKGKKINNFCDFKKSK